MRDLREGFLNVCLVTNRNFCVLLLSLISLITSEHLLVDVKEEGNDLQIFVSIFFIC